MEAGSEPFSGGAGERGAARIYTESKFLNVAHVTWLPLYSFKFQTCAYIRVNEGRVRQASLCHHQIVFCLLEI